MEAADRQGKVDGLHEVAGSDQGDVGGNAHERVDGLGLAHGADFVRERPEQHADHHRPPQLRHTKEQRIRPVLHHLACRDVA